MHLYIAKYGEFEHVSHTQQVMWSLRVSLHGVLEMNTR